MTIVPPWLTVAMLPLLLAATWFASLIMIGDVAQYVPFALLSLIIVSILCVNLIQRNQTVLLYFLCAAMILISMTFRFRKSGEVGLDFQNGYKMAIWGICILTFMCNFKRVIHYFNDPVFLTFGIFLLCNVVSSIYSPVPMISFAGSIGTIAYMGLALIVVETIDEKRIFQAIIACLFVYLVINVLSAFVSPETAWFLTDPDPAVGVYRFMGVSGQPNTLSRHCSIYIIFILCAYSRGYLSGRLTIGLTLFAFGMGMLTESRTPIMSLSVALLLQLPKRYLMPIGLVAGASILTMWFSGLFDLLLGMVGRDGNVDEAMTMAGRTELWSWVWDEIQKQPLIGHGYNSFESFAGENYPVGADKNIVRITHNAYLDALYSTGIAGTMFFVSAFLIMIHRWIVRPKFGRDLAMWSMILVGITEVELPGVAIMPPLMMFLMLAFDTKEFKHVAIS